LLLLISPPPIYLTRGHGDIFACAVINAVLTLLVPPRCSIKNEQKSMEFLLSEEKVLAWIPTMMS